MGSCLTDADLCCFHAMEADPKESQRVRAHLAACEACAKLDARLVQQHESWVVQLRDAGLPRTAAQDSDEPSPAMPPVGVIAGYELVQEISRGGQGIVYRAIQKSTRRPVAIKVLREGPFASRSLRRRFEREIELVAGLRHPNIVAIFDSGVTADGRQFCVMDYVEGERLDRSVHSRGLAVRDVLSLFARVCDAVNHAHQRGVIHRDLKPSNILVDPAGEPRVLDFGLAKQLGESGESLLATTVQGIAGTLPFLSPEQALGRHGEVDIRSDVYSLGVVLYQLLTGVFPYSVNGDMSTVLRNIAEAPPQAPSRAANVRRIGSRGIDDEIETVLLKSLAKERDRRYQTAGELARDIRHYLNDEPIDARRDSNWYIFRKTLRRYRLALSLAAAVVLIVSLSAMTLALMYQRQGRLLADVEAQRNIARAAETTARERFDDLHRLATDVIFTFDGQIRDVPGTTPARAYLVKSGLAYLDKIAAAASTDDLQKKIDLGAAYFKLGDIQGDPDLPNLGDHEGALSSYQRGMPFVEAAARGRPDSVHAQCSLATAYNRMGNLLGAMRRTDEARSFYAKAARLLEREAALHPKDLEVKSNLTFNQQLDVQDLRAAGRFDEALAKQREILVVMQSVVDATPNDDVARRELAVSHDKLGRILTAQGKLEEAMVEHKRFVDAMEPLVARQPQMIPARRSLGVGYERIGFIYQQQGKLKDALEWFEKAKEVAVAISKADRQNTVALTDAATAYCREGEVRLALGKHETARTCFEQYRSCAQDLARLSPGSAAALRDLGVSHYKMAEYHKSLGADAQSASADRATHWRNARAAFQACLDVFAEMRIRNLLAASDADVSSNVEKEIANCDDQIAALSP